MAAVAMTRFSLADLIVHDEAATALVAGPRVVTWGELRARLIMSTWAPDTRVALQPTADVDTIIAILGIINAGAVPVLAHHKWPAAMAQTAFALAGVGRAWPASWPASTVLFTSGSTGAPKAVVHDVSAHVDNARGALTVMPFGAGCRWLLSLPLGHVGGLAVLFRALVGGGAVVLPSSTVLRDSIIDARPTHLSLVAAQLQQLLDDDDALAVLREHGEVILVGGGPTSPALLARAVDAGLPVHQTWGLTEMGSQVCTSARGAVTTCGPALPGRFVRARADGELVVSGAGRFAGFLAVDTLQTPFDDDGGYATGDLGTIDDAGRVVVTGRKGNRFISGGENIQPETIEAAIGGSDVVVVVVAVTDDRFGKRPFAFFAGANSDEAVVATLRARANELLPRFMHPVGYARLPDQGGLKPRRNDLVTLAETLRLQGALS